MARKTKDLKSELATLIEQHGWAEVFWKMADLVSLDRLGIANDHICCAESLRDEIRRVLRKRDIMNAPVFNSLNK